MTQTIAVDCPLGPSRTGLAIGCTVYQLDGSTVVSAFDVTGWYEAPAGFGSWHHPGVVGPDAGGVIAVGISGTEYARQAFPAVPATVTGFATPADVTAAQTAITTAIGLLNDLSTTDIDDRLTAYDGATKADLDAAQLAIQTDIGNIPPGGLNEAETIAAVTEALTTYDSVTQADLDAAQLAIQTDIGNIPGGGMPTSIFTYTITNLVTGLPIDGVRVWIATDAEGTNIIWTGVTDTSGVARDGFGNLPRLDPATYYIYRKHSGFSFDDPDVEIVN